MKKTLIEIIIVFKAFKRLNSSRPGVEFNNYTYFWLITLSWCEQLNWESFTTRLKRIVAENEVIFDLYTS